MKRAERLFKRVVGLPKDQRDGVLSLVEHELRFIRALPLIEQFTGPNPKLWARIVRTLGAHNPHLNRIRYIAERNGWIAS